MSGVFPQCRQRVFRRVCGIGRCLSALCWLFGHEGVFASVGAALESDEPSVVDGAVDEGGGHVLVAEHASPSAEFDVGGVDDAPCLVGIGCLCSISCCGFSHDDFSGLGRACRPRNGLNWMVLVSPPERTGKDYDQHAPSTVYPSFAAERGIRRVDRAENTCQRADGA